MPTTFRPLSLRLPHLCKAPEERHVACACVPSGHQTECTLCRILRSGRGTSLLLCRILYKFGISSAESGFQARARLSAPFRSDEGKRHCIRCSFVVPGGTDTAHCLKLSWENMPTCPSPEGHNCSRSLFMNNVSTHWEEEFRVSSFLTLLHQRPAAPAGSYTMAHYHVLRLVGCSYTLDKALRFCVMYQRQHLTTSTCMCMCTRTYSYMASSPTCHDQEEISVALA